MNSIESLLIITILAKELITPIFLIIIFLLFFIIIKILLYFEQIYLNYKNKKIAKMFREQNINELNPYIFSKYLAREKETEEILEQRKVYKNA